MKKMNNKGFSLVELIVVVAIMAILIGVLAPQYLRYVEKSRLQKDNSAIGEIAQSMKIALADEAINSATDFPCSLAFTAPSGGGNQTLTFDGTPTGTAALEDELKKVVGDSYTTTSNTYKESGTAITLTATSENGVISVYATGWVGTVGSSSTESKTF